MGYFDTGDSSVMVMVLRSERRLRGNNGLVKEVRDEAMYIDVADKNTVSFA